MDTNDLMALKALTEKSDMSSYEQAMLIEKASRRPSNAALWGVGLGVFGGVAAIGAWIFGGTYANARARGNCDLINAYANHSQQMENLLASHFANERQERVSNQAAVNKTIIDITSGALAGSASNSSAWANAESQIVANALTGVTSRCPTPVSLYSAPQPCACPNSGCNC